MKEPRSSPTQQDSGVPDSWTRAKLIEPSSAGFVHVGASSGAWRLPIALPRAGRRRILAEMSRAAARLRTDPRVVRADVFAAVVRPPGQQAGAATTGRSVPDADFDAVLLVETTTVGQASELLTDRVLAELMQAMERSADRSLVFAGSNARRIATVDHERQGVFLFNYFSADSVETNLHAWQYTAGWFQDQTGLTNSTVLQPLDANAVPYSLVNHCRWDRLRDVLPSLVFKRSFRDFVLRVFADNAVIPRPILYKLHRAVGPGTE